MFSKAKTAGIGENHELRVAAGIWFKSLREAAGLSQRDLANRLNLDYYTFISQLENGRGRIPANRCRDWAKALQVDPHYFAKNLLSYYDTETFNILFEDNNTAHKTSD